jgi:4-amino-4-deoxy-L-arabinose transferase-like glycosyltransferase
LWLLIAWALGVLIPFTLATSKTPTSTLPAWPAMFLIAGAFVSRAIRADRLAASIWMGAAVVVVAASYFGAREPGAAWIIAQVIAGCALGVGLYYVIPARSKLVIVAGACSIVLFTLMIRKAWKATQINTNAPAYVALANYVRDNLPKNAALLVDEEAKLESNTAMFRTRRTAYPLRDMTWQQMGREVIKGGGMPYVVSHRPLPLKPLYTDPDDQRTIYEWSDAQ